MTQRGNQGFDKQPISYRPQAGCRSFGRAATEACRCGVSHERLRPQAVRRSTWLFSHSRWVGVDSTLRLMDSDFLCPRLSHLSSRGNYSSAPDAGPPHCHFFLKHRHLPCE
jgi:hypothetical protein